MRARGTDGGCGLEGCDPSKRREQDGQRICAIRCDWLSSQYAKPRSSGTARLGRPAQPGLAKSRNNGLTSASGCKWEVTSKFPVKRYNSGRSPGVIPQFLSTRRQAASPARQPRMRRALHVPTSPSSRLRPLLAPCFELYSALSRPTAAAAAYPT